MRRKTPAWQAAFWTPAQFAAVERKRAVGYRIDGPEFVVLVVADGLVFRCPVCGVRHYHGFPENTDVPVHRAAHCTLTVLGERRSALSRLGYLLRPVRMEPGSEAVNLRRIDRENERAMARWLGWVLPLLEVLDVAPMSDRDLAGLGMWFFGDTSNEYAAAGELERRLWFEVMRIAAAINARVDAARRDVH